MCILAERGGKDLRQQRTGGGEKVSGGGAYRPTELTNCTRKLYKGEKKQSKMGERTCPVWHNIITYLSMEKACRGVGRWVF